jgi:iron complex outermembrane receptor protein
MSKCQLTIARASTAAFAGIAAYLLAGTALKAATVTADSATSAANGDSSAFEEVVVTARKRSELAQTVPISMNVLTQADLDSKGIKTIQDLRFASPSVYIQQDQFQQDTVNVTIRGLKNYPSNGVQFDTSTAVYIDGVYIARTQGLAGSLFDVNNVEVLKGPQGTLVGRNSTGGAILYSTKEPEKDFGGYFSATGGDYGERGLEGALNLPITEDLAIRGAVSYDTRQGYIDNIYYNPATNQRNDTAALGYRKLAGKFSAKYENDDGWKVVLRADLSEEHDTGSAYHDLGYFKGTVASLGRPSICNIPGTCNAVGGTTFTDLQGHVIAPYYSNVATGAINTDPRSYNAVLNSLARQANNFWSTDQSNDGEDVDHFQTYSAAISKSFNDQIDVKLLGSYRTYDATGFSTSRGLPYDTIQTVYDVPDYEAYTSELTVNGVAFDDKFKWTTGLFYFRESSPDSGSTQYLYSPNYPFPAATSGHQVTLTDTSRNGGSNASYAGYAQGTYNILDSLRLTAGVRYTIDRRDAELASDSVRFPATPATNALIANSVYNPGNYTLNGITYKGYSTSCALTGTNGKPLPLSQCDFSLAKKYERPTWTLSLDYDLFEHTLVYFTTRTGYKSGAINTAATNASVTQARPETVQDYEIGAKSDWSIAGIPLRTNFALYQTDYQNIQVQISLPNATFASVAGGGPCTQAAFNLALCSGTTNDNVTVNAKSAQIYGYEWEFNAKPIPQVTLGYSGSYLHARYTDFSYPIPTGYLQPAGGAANFTGSAFPLPTWQMNASATYMLTGEELGGLPVDDVSLTANWYWQSKFLGNFTGFQFPAQQAAGYGMTNLRLNIDNIAETNTSVSFQVSNLFDKKACYPESGTTGGGGAGLLNSAPNATFGTPNTSGVLQCVPLAPRMFAVNLKYVFGGPTQSSDAPPAAYVPPPVVAPSPAPKSYLVFFDFNKSDLTPQAVTIVDQAAHNAGPAKVTKLEVTGHTDTVGSDAYNMRLSRRRAESVAAQLEKDGIPSSEIAIFAKGKHDLLIPTADGVKEPQNRRVQIVYSEGAAS